MNRAWIAASAALLLAAPAAQAGVGEGDIEVGVSISLVYTEVEFEDGSTTDQDSGIISASGGYFLNDMIELKGALTLVVTSDVTAGSINPGVDFLFQGQGSTVVPFAGGSYGLAVGDFDDTDFFEVHGGIKYFFRERASVEVKLSRSEPVDSDFDVGHTDLFAGINVYY
ncbi:MAG: hypothetical protein ACRES8_03195 [Nevskiaceae bacterium]